MCLTADQGVASSNPQPALIMIKPGHIIFVEIDHEIIAGHSGSSRLTADLGVPSSNPQPALIMIEPGHIIFVEIDREIIACLSGSSRMRI